MTTGWGAPHHAYEFTAAIADGDIAAADAVWKELDRRGQLDLLLALGAQARLSAGYLPDAADRVRAAQHIDLLIALRRAGLHEGAAAYAVAALDGSPRPRRPDCADPRCLRAAAACMAEVRLATLAGVGFSRRSMAVICHRQARG